MPEKYLYLPKISMMKTYLQARGQNVENQSDEAITELFVSLNTQALSQFQKEILPAEEKAEFLEMSRQIQAEIKKITQLALVYQCIDNYIEKYPFDELKSLLLRGVKSIPPTSIEIACQIKSYQYQELWLQKIEQNLSVLPIEERTVLLDEYQNASLKVLLKAYQQSCRSQEVVKMQAIAQSKLAILQEIFPHLLESHYKAYYDQSARKQELMREILRYTRAYTSAALKALSFDQLLRLKEEVQKQKQTEMQSKKLILEHIQALESSLSMINDSDFEFACIRAIKDLSSEELQHVLKHIGARNRFFTKRFEAVAFSLPGKVREKIFKE